ncbi:hypothetical protein [Chryseobacterium sp. MFBS3-17]|uniref:hypothetical protein n=1 Tax=Chryseobacterium sp. MFBS3-17 TaxID=2886689 RepID=UPI001D0F0238|nr:hypothetical protein [Chryseobacterium sp. MFBS3-17]MCC2590718.1 hypothetical protein [Chryseobacterium sp. MFBS3-17]
MFRKLIAAIAACTISLSIHAQKVDYKNNLISVNQKPVAKVTVEKQNFGLTKNFNLLSLDGQKLIIAVLDTESASDASDNTSMYYRFTFVPTNKVGTFKLSTLGAEKAFANLIGKSNIIENNSLVADKVNELIASKGVTPKLAVSYTLVSRNRNWPIEIKDTRKIEQGGEEIGFFQNMGQRNGIDTYQYFLPTGVAVGTVSFAGGENAQNFEFFSHKDNRKINIAIPQKEQIKFSASTVDPNFQTLKRITAWLVEKNYL